MAVLVWTVLAAAVGVWMYNLLSSLQKNIAVAKASGMPYLVGPFFHVCYGWQALSPFVVPILRWIPIPGVQLWLDVAQHNFFWRQGYKVFEKMGSDNFLIVSPKSFYMVTADPAVAVEIGNRRTDFSKPSWVYKLIDLFGTNVVSTEGKDWVRHRKAASAAFGESLNELVWTESIAQTQSMIESWVATAPSSADKIKITKVETDLASLSLHVISGAGFGIKLHWPYEKAHSATGLSSISPPPGKHFTFKNAMSTMLHGVLMIIVIPHWFLRIAPSRWLRDLYKSYVDCEAYFEQMRMEQIELVESGDDSNKADLMTRLVRSAMEETTSEKGGVSALLSKEELTGNFFTMLFAGHETTALSIAYTLIYIAIRRDFQLLMQRDITEIFGCLDPSLWMYKTGISQLSGSAVQAASLEQLRLISPVSAVPKMTYKAETITINGCSIIVPANTFIHIDFTALHRNPNYWANNPSKVSDSPHDLGDFVPERWLKQDTKAEAEDTTSPKSKSKSEPESESESEITFTSTPLLVPIPGSYIPFSTGVRSCIGRRFAMVEILVVLSVILQTYTVELDTSEWMADGEAEIATMTSEQQLGCYQKAIDKAEWLLKNNCEALATLQLRNGVIPLQFSKRGLEQFQLWE